MTSSLFSATRDKSWCRRDPWLLTGYAKWKLEIASWLKDRDLLFIFWFWIQRELSWWIDSSCDGFLTKKCSSVWSSLANCTFPSLKQGLLTSFIYGNDFLSSPFMILLTCCSFGYIWIELIGSFGGIWFGLEAKFLINVDTGFTYDWMLSTY